MIDRKLLNSRLQEAYKLLLYKGCITSKSDLARAIGMNINNLTSAFTACGRTMTQGLLRRIADAFPDVISREYMETGEGSVDASAQATALTSVQAAAPAYGLPSAPAAAAVADDPDGPAVIELDYYDAEALRALARGENPVPKRMPVVAQPHERREAALYKLFEMPDDSMEPRIGRGWQFLGKLIPEDYPELAENYVLVIAPGTAEAPGLATVRHVALNALRIGGDLITFEAERPGAELTALDRAAIRALYRYKRATSAPLD